MTLLEKLPEKNWKYTSKTYRGAIIHIKGSMKKRTSETSKTWKKIHTKWSKMVHTIKKNTEGKNAESPGG